MDQEFIRFSDHVVRYEDEDGEEQEILVTFEFGPDEDFPIDDDVNLILRTGRASFELSGEFFQSRRPVKIKYSSSIAS